MAKKTMGLVLALDGEQKFREGLRNASKQVALNKTAIKDLSTEYKTNANSLEYLQKKQELMKSQQDALNKKLEAAKTGFDNATKTYDKQKSALEELQKKYKTASDALEAMKKSGKEGTDEYQALEAECNKLAEAVDKQTTNVLKADTRITDWQKNINTTESAIRQMSSSMDENAKYIAEAEKSADKCATSIDNMGKAVEGAADGGSTIEQAFGEVAVGGLRKLGEIGVEALGQLKDAAKEAAEYAVEVGSSFEAGLSEVEAISGATDGEMDKLSAKARALGSSTKFSATEVTSAMTNMSLAGWKVQQTLSGIDGVLNLASASGMDLAEASQVVTDNISVFNLQAEQASTIADQMAYSQAHSSTTAAELGQAYKNCGANMNAAGQDISTTTVLLEALANKGLRSAEAGTAQAAIMRDMISKMSDGAIKIGETSVQVADANGNFRNMIDIIADVEAATNGLSDSQKQEALMSTFTSDSTKALNMLLATGSDNLREMADELDNCQGAAEDMSKIMQDNLKGAMTELGSAQEGLGIAVYNLFSGPLTSAVRIATSAIAGVTDLITPATQAVDEYYQSVMDGAEQAKQKMADISTGWDAGIENADRISALGARLEVLNGIENKTAVQRQEMAAIVSELSQTIPELTSAYDAENGSLNMTNTELETLINNYEQSAVKAALLASTQDLVNQKLLAQAEIVKATSGLESTEKRIDLLEQERDLIWDIQTRQNNGDYSRDYGTEALAMYKKALDAGTISLEEYHEAEEQIGKGDMAHRLAAINGEFWDGGDAAGIMHASLSELSDKSNDYNKVIKEQSDISADCDEKMQDYTKAAEEMYGITSDGTDATSENTDATNENTDALAGNTEALTAQADAAKEAASAEYQAAQQRREAAQSIVDAYTSAKEQVSQQFQNKISLFDMFDWEEDTGTDMTVEEMTANLESQVDAMLHYKSNLERVVSEIGGKVSPEFIKYIEDMGMEGANVLEHMVITLEGQGTGPIEDMADAWAQAMNISDGIGAAEAANEVAIQAAANNFGSTAQEWSGVWDAITIANNNGLENWGQSVSADLEEQLQDVISMAQEVGAAIPDGLADGIASGDVSPEEAIAQLQGQITGQMDGLLQVAQQAGIQVPQGIQDGIAAGGDATVQAYRDLITLLGDSNVDLAQVAEKQGTKYTEGLAKTDTSSAGSAMAEGAADGADQQSDGFSQAGAQAGESYNQALGSKASPAVAIANNYSKRVMAALASRENQAYNIGANIGLGVAQGINAKISVAETSAYNAINRIMRAMQNAADIHSPSRKADKKIGQQIPAGVAQGITKASSKAEKAAAESVKKALAAAQAQAKKSYQSAYNIVGQSDWANQVSNSFFVSKTTGTGKDKKTKDIDTYYSDVLSAAEKYMDHYQALHQVSEEQELKYWQGVKTRLAGGTDAWYSAVKKINELQSSIEETQKKAEENQKKQHVQMTNSILSTYKKFYNVSSKAEMEYWNIVRQQFKKGSQERVDADAQYLEAKQAYYDDLLEIEETYREKSEKINSDLYDSIKDLNDAYHDAVASRKSDILSQFSLFESWDSTGYDADTLLYNLQTQVSGLALWEQQFEELSKKNISSGLLEELKNMGPEAAASIYSLNQMTEEQLKQYDALWQKRDALAQNQAVKDNSGLLDSTNEQIKSLRSTAQVELDNLVKDLRNQLDNIGQDINNWLYILASNAGNLTEDKLAEIMGSFGEGGWATPSTDRNIDLSNKITINWDGITEEAGQIGSDALDALLNELTNQDKIQRSLQSVTDMITADLSGLGALTGSGAQRISAQMSAQSQPVSIDTSGLNSSISGMAGAVASAVVSALSNMGIYINSDVLVGQIAPQVENSIAMGTVKRNGRL